MTSQISKASGRARIHLQTHRLSTVTPCGGSPSSWELWHCWARHRPPSLYLMEKPVWLSEAYYKQTMSCKCSHGSWSFGKCFSLRRYLTAWRMEPSRTALASCRSRPEPLAEAPPQCSWCPVPAGLRLPDLGRCSWVSGSLSLTQNFLYSLQTDFWHITFFFGTACRISVQFPDQGLNPGPWQWKPRILTTRPSWNSAWHVILVELLNHL